MEVTGGRLLARPVDRSVMPRPNKETILTSKAIVQGQIYRVQITGHKREEERTLVTKNEYAIIGNSTDDVRLKFAYVVDVSAFDHYRIDFVVREPDRCCLLRHSYEWVSHESPDAVIQRAEGTDTVWQKPVIDSAARKFLIHARTTCYASDEKHARKKLKKRVVDNEELIEFAIEELCVADGFAHAKDTSMFPRAHVIGGKA